MCLYRRVCNIYTRCGHAEQLPDQLIECDNPRCKFSPSHPHSCVLPRCRTSCIQNHGWPQQYSPNLDQFCTACRRGGRS